MASTTASSTGVHLEQPNISPPSDVTMTRNDLVHDGKDFDFENKTYQRNRQNLPVDPSLFHNGARSFSSIGIKAFLLGFTLASCIFGGTLLAYNDLTIWRLPAFFACLSVFHFLEFYTTARWNTPVVKASSFLFNNGVAYNIAHTLAATEVAVSFFFPTYQQRFVNLWTMAAGAIIVTIGQTVRSVAMAQAGTNFNHLPVQTKKEDHVLVTHGVYGWLRHPSYFGFFWWALGTQLLIGNKICFVGYLLALWNFFNRRIIAEERTLVKFFGADYEAFRRRTGTGIPLIR